MAAVIDRESAFSTSDLVTWSGEAFHTKIIGPHPVHN